MANTSYGTCMYLEFRMDSTTAQTIIIPEHARNGIASDGMSPVTVMHRRQDIQKNETRQKWLFFTVVSPTIGRRQISPSTDQIVPSFVTIDALIDARTMYTQMAPHFESLASARFILYKHPLFVEIGPAEIKEIDKGARPDGLLRRIDRVRKESGFSEELWEERYMH